MRPTRSEQDAPRPTQEEYARVKREFEEAERERQRLQRRIERLEKQNTRLRRQLDAARRAGYRQAAPFAKALTCRPKRPGRRAGAQYGQPARRRRPTRVDVRHDAPLPPGCPACGGQVRSTGVASQLQEELPVPRVVVREFRVALGACQDCGRRVQGRHRLQTSDALGAAAVQLGPGLVASVVVLNKQMGLSFGKIATLLRQHYDIRVSPSGLVRAVHRAARRAELTYSELLRQIRNSPVVTPDETGWKVGGHLQWLWAARRAEDDRLRDSARTRLRGGRQPVGAGLRRRAHPRRLGAVSTLYPSHPSDVPGAPPPTGTDLVQRPSPQSRRRRYPRLVEARATPAR